MCIAGVILQSGDIDHEFRLFLPSQILPVFLIPDEFDLCSHGFACDSFTVGQCICRKSILGKGEKLPFNNSSTFGSSLPWSPVDPGKKRRTSFSKLQIEQQFGKYLVRSES